MEQFANRTIGLDEPLAWQHMDALVTMDYLKKEHERSVKGVITPDCRERCNGCFGAENARYCSMHCPGSKFNKKPEETEERS